MLFLRLAILNIRKYKRRSAIIIFSVLLSVVVMVTVGGMMDGVRRSFFSELLQQSGHLQIHTAGWESRLDPYSIKYLIHDPDKIISTLEAHSVFAERAVHVEPILHFGALLVNGDKNVAMEGQGVLPDTSFFDRVRSHMLEGTFLQKSAAQSSAATATDGSGIALSASTAKLLNLKLGDQVVVLVQDSTGSPYYLSYPLTGIFHAGVTEIDEGNFFLSLGNAQQLLDVSGQASEIRITLRDPNSAAATAALLDPTLNDAGLSIQTWRQINGSLIVFIDMGDLFTLVINIFIVIVAATVITNSILMTVFERIPVFGTLRAIGLKRRQLFWMIIDEGFLLGLAGSILGLALGIPFVLYFQIHGLDVGAMSTALGTGTIYHFALTPVNVTESFLAGTLIAVVGSLYAAWVSVRMRLIETLQRQGA
ncbi:MAG TPA: FtsX-like permease family protein [Spirochaetia bacterium]|nr:FtsX-like permease family protein [Spirochaetia bacterium]